MSIEDALDNLRLAFDRAAHEIERIYPDVWKKAIEGFTHDGHIDINAAVSFLTESKAIGWGDKSLLEVIEKYGEQPVIDYIDAVHAGVYL